MKDNKLENVFTFVNFLPDDLALVIWKNVYSSNVVEKIKASTCSACGRYDKKLYNHVCLLCLVTRYPCMRCLKFIYESEQVLEMEPLLDGKFMLRKKHDPQWYTKQDLYERELLYKEKAIMNCEDLCDDVIENIFRFLSADELLSARFVCRKWREIIHRSAEPEILCLRIDEDEVKRQFPRSKRKLIFCEREQIITEDGDDAVEFRHRLADKSFVESTKFPGVARYYHDDTGKLVFVEELYYERGQKLERIVDIKYDETDSDEPIRVRVFPMQKV